MRIIPTIIIVSWLSLTTMFSQDGKVVRRETKFDDAGAVSSIFFAFSLENHPDYPGKTGYKEWTLQGDEMARLPATEPEREQAIQVIIQREIENAFVAWEKTLVGQPTIQSKDELERMVAGTLTRIKPAAKTIDLVKARARVAREEAAKVTTTTTTTLAVAVPVVTTTLPPMPR